MWVSRKKWIQLNKKIADIENRVSQQKQETDKKIYEMSKRILRQPKELSEEIDSMEDIERYVNDFICL